MSNELAEGEIENETVTLTPLGELAIMHNGAPLRLDMGKATDSEAGLRAYDEQTRQMIDDLLDLLDDCERIFESAKEEAQMRKKIVELAEEDLKKAIRERRDGRGKP
jgi:hypothetical protein